METAAGATGAVAEAAPVGKSAGTSGLGSTFVAVASPLLETTSRAVKACPRSMVDPPSAEARVSEPMARTEGRCTVVLDDAAVAVIAAPLPAVSPFLPFGLAEQLLGGADKVAAPLAMILLGVYLAVTAWFVRRWALPRDLP